MSRLLIAFLKIFYRNPRAMFFVIFMPAGLFLVLAFFGSRGVIDFRSAEPYDLFLLPGMIAYSIMQSGVYTTAYLLIEYKRTKILQRLSVTPLRPGQFLLAQSLSRFIIAIFQTVVLLALSTWIFKRDLQFSLLLFPVIIFFISSLFINFGFLIASVARDYEEAAPYTALISLPLTFLGDVFFPVKNLPPVFAHLADYLPLKPLVNMTRIMLGGGGVVTMPDVVVILAWLVITSFAAQILFFRKAYR